MYVQCHVIYDRSFPSHPVPVVPTPPVTSQIISTNNRQLLHKFMNVITYRSSVNATFFLQKHESMTHLKPEPVVRGI